MLGVKACGCFSSYWSPWHWGKSMSAKRTYRLLVTTASPISYDRCEVYVSRNALGLSVSVVCVRVWYNGSRTNNNLNLEFQSVRLGCCTALLRVIKTFLNIMKTLMCDWSSHDVSCGQHHKSLATAYLSKSRLELSTSIDHWHRKKLLTGWLMVMDIRSYNTHQSLSYIP